MPNMQIGGARAAHCRSPGAHSAPLTWVCIGGYISPRGYQTSLSCLLTQSGHKCAAACLDLRRRKLAGSLEGKNKGDLPGPFKREGVCEPREHRASFAFSPPPREQRPVSEQHCMSLSNPVSVIHPPHLPPHTFHIAVRPRGFCHARARPRAHSRPGRDVNYTVQRVGVYLRCLSRWQVRIGPRPRGGGGPGSSLEVAWVSCWGVARGVTNQCGVTAVFFFC